MGIKDADRIREFVYEHYIKPAKEKGLSSVPFKAGEIHKRMGFTKNNIPNIIGALCREIMKKRYGVKNIHREPPSDGLNVIITYEL
jgi:hypothetical protein